MTERLRAEAIAKIADAIRDVNLRIQEASCLGLIIELQYGINKNGHPQISVSARKS